MDLRYREHRLGRGRCNAMVSDNILWCNVGQPTSCLNLTMTRPTSCSDRYSFFQSPDFFPQGLEGKRVLELGSGTGLGEYQRKGHGDDRSSAISYPPTSVR